MGAPGAVSSTGGATGIACAATLTAATPTAPQAKAFRNSRRCMFSLPGFPRRGASARPHEWPMNCRVRLCRIARDARSLAYRSHPANPSPDAVGDDGKPPDIRHVEQFAHQPSARGLDRLHPRIDVVHLDIAEPVRGHVRGDV